MKVVCLSSGGLDSSVLMLMLQKMKYEIFPLHIDYGQNASIMEQKSLHKVCKFLKLKPKVLNISDVGTISTGITSQSQLTTENPIFPARNLMLLSIATAYALSKSILTISIGSTSNALFPDQRKSFMKKAELLLNSATGNHVKILTPLIDLNKREVVSLAKKHNFPLTMTYSCHVGKTKQCGICLNCKERTIAIQQEFNEY